MSITQDLIDILSLEKLEHGLYRGKSQNLVGKRVFGGQVLGQALLAASYTTDRPAHSMHAYFLFAGDINAPIIYQVESLRDGKSFVSRSVKAIQHGRTIFQAMVSFAPREEGLQFQVAEPHYPQVDELPSEEQLKKQMIASVPENYRQAFLRQRHIETVPINPTHPFEPQVDVPNQAYYFKTWDTIPSHSSVHDDNALHQAIIAFCSDYSLMTTCLRPHGLSWLSPSLQVASLDHTIYFHHPMRADEWLLYDMDATQTASSRGLSYGRIWQNGRLVCSTVQEGLVRLRDLDFSQG
ncbi:MULTISPECIES: acyl-CoA thioesterase [unclassified Acinetobacter]|uniref:acyl-CoA thioesterase n=1 Tax=unclassified Acinetobacter TaxID=196816 RepID=UPI0035B90302